MLKEGDSLSSLLSTLPGYPSPWTGGGGLVAPAASPGVAGVNNTDLGIVEEVVGSHWERFDW